MVADALATQAAPRKTGVRGPEVPLMLRLKIRTMYLNSGESLRTIAAKTGLTEKTVKQMVFKEGWTKLKCRLKETLVAQQDAERDEIVSQAMNQIKDESIAIAGESMAAIREALAAKSSKDFQALTAGARNLVSVAKAIMLPNATNGDGSTQVNVFVLRAGQMAAEDPKQVTEVEAKRVQ